MNVNAIPKHAPRTSSRCRSCQQVIEWQRTTTGKQMPVNPQRITVIDAQGRTVVGRESHFASCPAAAEFQGNSDHRNPTIR